MPWLEISVVVGIWLTVKGWLRSRRSGRAVPNSQRFNQSSRLTEAKRTLLADADPEQVAHNGMCENCGVQSIVPFRSTRLERRPWRLVWICQVCGRQSRAKVPPELVDLFVGWDRAGGMSLSMREVADFVNVDLDELERAVKDELT